MDKREAHGFPVFWCAHIKLYFPKDKLSIHVHDVTNVSNHAVATQPQHSHNTTATKKGYKMNHDASLAALIAAAGMTTADSLTYELPTNEKTYRTVDLLSQKASTLLAQTLLAIKIQCQHRVEQLRSDECMSSMMNALTAYATTYKRRLSFS